MIKLLCGDSVAMMKTLPDNSVDGIAVDPPYGLSEHRLKDVQECLRAWLSGEEYKPRAKAGFMGRSWDAWVPGPEVFREALRVIKPGGHMLCFAGTRSMDLMMMAVRLAGWELRDAIGSASDSGDPEQAALMAWVFGSGFPKNLDVSKAIDKMCGAVREVTQEGQTKAPELAGKFDQAPSSDRERRDIAVTEMAVKWQGWGTALKPAWEPIILARKPLDSTIAANVLKWGTGAINIDASRIEGNKPDTTRGAGGQNGRYAPIAAQGRIVDDGMGRWPANLVHDGSDVVMAAFPVAPGAHGDVRGDEPSSATANTYGARARVPYVRPASERGRRPGGFHDIGAASGDGVPNGPVYADGGSAARFFYCAKASKADRDDGLHGFELKEAGIKNDSGRGFSETDPMRKIMRANTHPTVKPLELMRYLVRLITPPGGVVLDFCMGSGSTGKACEIEGFEFIGIDIDPENVRIARERIGAGAPLFREIA